LRDHLCVKGIDLVVMEATRVYFTLFFFMLKARGLTEI